MNIKFVVTGVLILMVVTSMSNVAPPVTSNGVRFLIEETPYLAQEEEQYNVSSYYDFALATADVIASKLVNKTTGVVFTFGYPHWEYLSWSPALTDYYWAISGLSRVYEITGNTTLSVMISRAAKEMVRRFIDPTYLGFYTNGYSSDDDIAHSKRTGVQAYAYYALSIAEAVNSSLDFSAEKQHAIKCLTDVLYDPTYGGFRFLAFRNCTLDDDGIALEGYPNNGKRLDHISLGALALYDEGTIQGNSSMIAMANSALNFIISDMQYVNQSVFYGFRLATTRTGGDISTTEFERPARVVVSDVNALTIRAFLKGYNVTGNPVYLDWAEDTHTALLTHLWDTENGGWFAESLDGELWAPIGYEDTEGYKYSEIQFQMIFTEEHLYEATSKNFYIQTIIDVLDICLAKLWDKANGGFFANGDESSNVLTDEWRNHYTGVQALAVLALERVWSYGLPIVSYVRLNPTNPRPFDPLTFLATATDADGIDTVMVNMSAANGGPTNYTQFELEPNPEFGGVFNKTFGTLANGTRCNFLVIANDTLGNVFIAGNYYFIVRDDVWAPIVLLRTTYPSTEVRAGDHLVIEFGTYEFPTHSTITSFLMYWKVNDGAYAPYNMTHVDFDDQYYVWMIELGSFNAGDVISYYCLAEDESGNVGESAFYRLTILGIYNPAAPWSGWQIAATIGLVAAPGIGYGATKLRRQRAIGTQRELKKEAKKRSTKKRPRRQRRSTRGG